MLSGNGRHRRPRQAPALIVAAGVTGSAIAIPLLGATGASAAEGATWDRVAECESGGSWSENSGNGYYGGLQVTQEHWERYGGTTYAATADLASRSQQIAVAERILADRGLAAWPTCGPLSGLDKASGSADVDTGVAGDKAGSSGSSGFSGSSDSGGLLDSIDGSSGDGSSVGSSAGSSTDTSPSPETSGKTSDKSTKSDKSADGSDSEGSSEPSEADGSQGLDGEPADETEGDNSDNSGRSDGDSALTDTGTGRHRGDSADEGASDGRTGSTGRHASRGDAAARDAADGSYTVRDGDSLTSIADSLELSGGWRGLYAENEATVGADPDFIIPGQTLEVGVEPGEK
ncbi:transglycosylase family protein [Streptomyces sp. CC219B]|uniref:LysM peptidoglycan-binding domain-containing protein n=1 Tax=Streptomyces sp. CC219B TaxID=3044574 RepID=UPI0024A868F3|nr:transglycosylase family protein [Streptomyces sp. CC219B]